MRVPCVPHSFSVFFNDTATTEIYTYFHTLSLHDALPICRGQHVFFDIGNGDSLAFFWFKGAPEAVPGISAPEALPTQGNFMSAHGSMNHIAINVPAERFDEYYNRLVEKGVKVTKILNHDNSTTQSSDEVNDDVFVRSVQHRKSDV